MDTMWLITFVAGLVAAAVALVLPLVGPRLPWHSSLGTELDRLLQEKARVLRALKDLQHERAGGFLNEREFQETRRDYVEQAARLNRGLQRLTGISPATRERAHREEAEEEGAAPHGEGES